MDRTTPRPPRRAAAPPPVAVLMAMTMTITATACSGGGGSSGSAAKSASPNTQLTDSQAKSALIGISALGAQWKAGAGSASAGTQDALLRSRTDKPDCQVLLDRLNSVDLFGAGPTAKSTEAFTESSRNARLTYQVASYRPDALDKAMDWLKTLPAGCDAFTATDPSGNKVNGQVVATKMPDVGDDRIGLRTTLATTVQGLKATLTLDTAAVRVGSSAVTVTNGGLDGAEGSATEQAVRKGVPRLTEALAGKTPAS